VTETRFVLNALKVSGITLYYPDEPALAANAVVIKRLARLLDVTEGSGWHRALPDDHRLSLLARYRPSDRPGLPRRAPNQASGPASGHHPTSKAFSPMIVTSKMPPSKVVEQTKDQLATAQALLASLAKEHKRFSV